MTPLGQFGVSQAIDDNNKGNHAIAVLGVVTSGELPELRVAKGLSLGQDFGKLGKVAENVAPFTCQKA